MSIPTEEPKKFVAGDTLKFTRSFPDYSPSEWTLSYSLRGPKAINFSATQSGSLFLVNVAASTTAEYSEGKYSWECYVTKAGERYRVGNGKIEIQLSLSQVTDEGFDGRSPAKIGLDKVNEVLSLDAEHREREYEIDGVRVRGKDTADLLTLRSHFAGLVAQENSKMEIENGRPGRKKILTRFVR